MPNDIIVILLTLPSCRFFSSLMQIRCISLNKDICRRVNNHATNDKATCYAQLYENMGLIDTDVGALKQVWSCWFKHVACNCCVELDFECAKIRIFCFRHSALSPLGLGSSWRFFVLFILSRKWADCDCIQRYILSAHTKLYWTMK